MCLQLCSALTSPSCWSEQVQYHARSLNVDGRGGYALVANPRFNPSAHFEADLDADVAGAGHH